MAGTPSYRGFNSSSPSASRAKRANICADTAHERSLRSSLWRLGVRFRKNVRALPGKPDIVFSSAKVAVFCDGDFWHGRNWPSLEDALRNGANSRYWTAKIASNRSRDQRVTAELEAAGWWVLREWEGDIRKDPELIARRIVAIVRSRAVA